MTLKAHLMKFKELPWWVVSVHHNYNYINSR